MSKTIKEWQQEIYQNNKEKGFWDSERNFGELLMLVVSELGEALEAHRKNKISNIERYKEYVLLKPIDSDEIISFEKYIKDTVEDEIADAVIRLLDLSEGLGIDLEWHIEQKVAYNKTRPVKHGKNY